MAIKILIVDDNAVIRMALRRYLEEEEDFIVVGEAVDGRDGIAKAEELLPDVILMDLSMPEMDGIDATHIISRRQPWVKVLMLSVYDSSDHCTRAVNAGAHGYVLKELSAVEVAAAIHALMIGRFYFGYGVPSLGETLNDRMIQVDHVDKLCTQTVLKPLP